MSEVRKLWIPGPAGRLEAALRWPSEAPPRALAVLAHPHPLYGGTLHNPVVFHADRALHEAGLGTLRFDFRGAGGSEGAHDEGRGEVDDVGAAVSWLRGLAPGRPMILVGYSFGAWCALRHAARDPSVTGVVAVGLPVEIYAFDGSPGKGPAGIAPVSLASLGRPLAVVQGQDDDLGTPEKVRAVRSGTRPEARLRIVPATTHLFPGRAPDAAREVAAAVEEMLAPAGADQAG